MENTSNYDYQNVIQLDDVDSSRKFMANVFLWMFIALGISAGLAWYVSTNDAILSLMYDANTGKRSGLGTIIMFSPLAFVLLMSFGLNRISAPVLTLLFIAYATLTGISLSFIFLAYTSTSILSVFLSASLLFAVMAVAGYTTKQDLTSFGNIMMIGLVGIFIAMMVNWFLQSEQLSYIVSFIGVAIFTGLTMYDVNKLKRIGAGIEYGTADSKKMVIMGALTLYLDFLNLFLMLLRLFGGRK